eukprot:3296599-Alexandrium_andersonii.AAC.1
MSSERVRTCTFSSGWGRRCAPCRSRATIRVRGAGSVSSGAPEARSAMAAASVCCQMCRRSALMAS